VAAAFLAALWRRRAERARDGFPPLRDAWVARAHQLGTPITISGMDTGTAAPLRGTYEGIDLDGALLLRSGGQVRRVLTGEVVT
jgi:biotin-(acetyl-CoA carboxylase) ligase